MVKVNSSERSIQEGSSVTPATVFFFLALGCSLHSTLIRRSRDVAHVGHFRDLGSRCSAHELLVSWLSLVVLLVLSILVLSLGLFLTIKHGKLLLELVILHAELTSDGHKTSEAINVILVFFIDLLVDLQSLVKEIHSAITRGNHELPLDLFRLNLRGAFEVLDGLFKHVLLGVVHTEAGDDVDLGWVVSVGFLVEMNGLEFVLFLLVEVAHLGEDFRVGGDLGDEDVVPFEGFTTHADEFVDVSDLVEDLVAVWNDSVELLKGLQ